MVVKRIECLAKQESLSELQEKLNNLNFGQSVSFDGTICLVQRALNRKSTALYSFFISAGEIIIKRVGGDIRKDKGGRNFYNFASRERSFSLSPYVNGRWQLVTKDSRSFSESFKPPFLRVNALYLGRDSEVRLYLEKSGLQS